MPLLRGLRTLQEQAENRALRRIIEALSLVIEDGSSFAEALALHPRIFNPLYINMVKAGEIGGALDVTLRRLADFMEKAQKIKGKVKAAMYYPCAVLSVATIILTLLMTYVVPRFKDVLEGLLGGARMPPFTLFVLRLSEAVKHHILLVLVAAAALGMAFLCALRTGWGRWSFDQFKLAMPVLGTGLPESRHLPLQPHAWNPAQQRRADPPGADHREGNRRQRRRRRASSPTCTSRSRKATPSPRP